MTTAKAIALTRRTFVDKIMPLLFNMLSRLVITFLPRGKHLLISWLQSPSAVIWEPRKIKSGTVSTVSPSICHYLPQKGLPWWLRCQRICLQCRRPRFNLWVIKIPWWREWLPTPVFLPEEFQGKRRLAGYSPWGRKESDMTEQLTLSLSPPKRCWL